MHRWLRNFTRHPTTTVGSDLAGRVSWTHGGGPVATGQMVRAAEILKALTPPFLLAIVSLGWPARAKSRFILMPLP